MQQATRAPALRRRTTGTSRAPISSSSHGNCPPHRMPRRRTRHGAAARGMPPPHTTCRLRTRHTAAAHGIPPPHTACRRGSHAMQRFRSRGAPSGWAAISACACDARVRTHVMRARAVRWKPRVRCSCTFEGSAHARGRGRGRGAWARGAGRRAAGGGVLVHPLRVGDRLAMHLDYLRVLSCVPGGPTRAAVWATAERHAQRRRRRDAGLHRFGRTLSAYAASHCGSSRSLQLARQLPV
jgi:hypothetical protein